MSSEPLAGDTLNAARPPVVDRLALVGIGLIGGSLARALRAAGWAREIEGAVLTHAELDEALALGILDAGSTDVASVCGGADLIVVATDMRAMPAIFGEIATVMGPVTVVTDVGSVKASVIADARRGLGSHFPRYVPGHPIAGTEKSGVKAGFTELFCGRRSVLTPLAETHPDAVALVTDMWSTVGAAVHCMTPEDHDATFALTSHLPHLIAYAMVAQLAAADASVPLDARPGPLDFAAGGFADITRIAQSRADLWVDILGRNQTAVITHGRAFLQAVSSMLDLLEAGDAVALESVFARAVETRRALEASRPHSS